MKTPLHLGACRSAVFLFPTLGSNRSLDCTVWPDPEPQVYESQVVVVQMSRAQPSWKEPPRRACCLDRTAARYGVYTIERVFPFLDHVQPRKDQAESRALRHTYYVRYSTGDDPERVAKRWPSIPGVIYAEPVIVNRLLESEVRVEPNDSLFSDQTYLRHLRLPEAWDIVKGEDMSRRW